MLASIKIPIFASMVKHLYIIAGCNGAGKTTASMTILPKSLLVKERVSEGGHNIPTDTIIRRYTAGIRNLFNIFMQEVDIWTIYDNSDESRERVAFGGNAIHTRINNKTKFEKICQIVK